MVDLAGKNGRLLVCSPEFSTQNRHRVKLEGSRLFRRKWLAAVGHQHLPQWNRAAK
jgi:hypothetical protein